MTCFAVFIDGPWADAIVCLNFLDDPASQLQKSYVLPNFQTNEPAVYELREIISGCAVYRYKAEALAQAGHYAAAD